jgi:DNA polymerase III sliding clamp (beta) subunit (PCNA family)
LKGKKYVNVEIEIRVADLKTVLPGLSKIIPGPTTLPVLQNVKVSLDAGEKIISLQAQNLDENATVRVPNKANGRCGALLFPLEPVSRIVKGCPAEQSVRFVRAEQETKIRYPAAGSWVERVLSHVRPEEWPEIKVISRQTFDLDEAFKQALREAQECAGVASSRHVLNGACLDTRDNAAHYVVGTDGRHLYSANSFRFNLPGALIIPTGRFASWPGFVNDGPWKLRTLPAVKVDPDDHKADRSQEAPPWVQIDSQHWSYVIRGIDGQFPEWRQAVPAVTGSWTRVVLAGSAAHDLLQAIALLPGAETLDHTLVLEIAAGRLALKARGPGQQGWTRILVAGTRITGKPVQTSLNRDYLLRALRFGFKEISIADSLSPLVFSHPAKTMIVMPIRWGGPAALANPGPSAPAEQTISRPEKTPAAPPSGPGGR